MEMRSRQFFYKIFYTFLAILFFFVPDIMGQNRKVRVGGTVVDENGRPVAGINIYDKSQPAAPIGGTNDDGKFSVLIDRNGTLVFSSAFYKERSVSVRGRTEINVKLESESRQLEEVVIQGELRTVKPVDSEMEIRGNYLLYTVGTTIPKNILKRPDIRVVCQPQVFNLTRNTQQYGTPFVCDLPEYAITQERMYNFDIKQDPLSAYRVVVTDRGENYEFRRQDSLYLSDPRNPDEFLSVMWTGIENYRKVIDLKSDTTGHGVSNPLYFLQYDLVTADISDSVWVPKPMPRRRNDRQELDLTFLVGRAVLDETNPQNAVELDKLTRRLSAIENNPDASLDTFAISGVASPDGAYENNKRLAELRSKETSGRLLRGLRPDTRQYLKVFSDARVERWDVVAEMMEEDSVPGVEKVREIIDKYPNNPDLQWQHIVRLPFYKSIISAEYLPRLRKVEARYSYIIHRNLNDNEIKDLYEQDYKELDRYEFFRLSQLDMSEEAREKVCRQALEVYPDFLWMANKLTVLTIKANRPDPSVLLPFIHEVKHGRYKNGRKLPREFWANQVTAFLGSANYSKADSVMNEYLSYQRDSSQLIIRLEALTSILNGRVRSKRAYDYFISEGGINEVVMLLSLRDNEAAYEKSKKLPVDDARCLYVRAMAANRMGEAKMNEASINLCQAIALDPSLKDRAKVDREVRELLDLCY